MDGTLAAAIITSIATAASTAGVAVTTLISQNSRVSRVETRIDELNTTLHLLNGSLHEIDKRLGMVADRIFNR